MRKLALFLSMVLFLGLQTLNAQTKAISGKVVDNYGDPIPGVSIIVKGTTSGTVSRPDGSYLLNVPQDAEIIVFTFVGMETKEIMIGDRSSINVMLASSAIDVDEVVVTALGISREKKSLGYASQGVSEDDLMAANDVNAIASLSGKVAGLSVSGQNFAGSQNILIRGASSFSGNNQPLFVVDGVPISNEGFNDVETQSGGGGYDYGSMVADLNSYDIANVEVLKGSAASALYGSRGQNGVIMITTKSGRKGKKTFSVDINSGVTIDRVSILPELQDKYGGGYGGFGSTTIDGVEYQTVSYAVDESWGPKFEGQDVLHWWGIADYEQGLTSAPVTGKWEASKNDVEDFYETGITYQNSINVVSTSENSALRIGYTNISMEGIVPNSKQNKNTFNINGNTSVLDGFVELNSNVTFVHTDTKGRPQFGYGDNSQSQKFFQWGQRQLDMDKLKNYANPDGTNRTWNRTSASDATPKYSDNPYWTAYKNYQDDDRTRIFGTVGGKINLTDYLSASGNVYLDTYTFNARERVAIGSQAQSMFKQVQRQAIETNYEGKLNFQKRFGDLDVLGFVGGNIRKENYSRFEGETDGGLVIDGLYNLNNSANQPILDDYDREKRVNSWFGMASVGYKSFAYLEATYRTDYDSTLPEEHNEYSYASVSGSVILSQLLKYSWMNNLKVRLNYGETGNGTDPYQVYNTYEISDPFQGNPQFTNLDRLKNENLKPELTQEVEFGVEGSFLHNRAGFDFTYYTRDTENQIVPVEVSGSTGYIEQVINAGLINNRGIELMVYGTPLKVGDFSWELGINYAKNTNEVKELPASLGGKLQLASAPFGGAYINSVEGKTFQELYAYDFVYDDNGNKVINSETGFYEMGDLQSMGSVLPDYTAGLKSTFRYKNIDLGVLIDMSKGGKYYSLTNMWSMYSGMAEATATATSNGNTIREDGLVLDGVVDKGNGYEENDMHLSAIDYGEYHYHGYDTPSATSVFDADYVKLREVTIGYTLPKVVDVIKSIRVSAYGRNLAIWGLDNKGIDPETIVGGNGNIQGLEGGIVPGSKSYGFNVQIKF
ncbi:SusC/RagA family TonB-linked outer membrane protein [Saccharicrinis fermentans]|uniref:SusC/RagA family TonB-linked outer membrane protein n=2 Tax=Saccharicrinis fermentans TaxID=982 RepID=UPI0005C7541D|nr:SusC/RagA family TonB-linked outer membrane protein [Saccharicrinis fermentans]